ncbi:PepSY domain-containing protein [Modestobacter versicolor]|uniref:PepSY domain-containing protein n=1 Tax=Modestobacter versicolor TaxID=429133 RepID=UPI0034DEB0DB
MNTARLRSTRVLVSAVTGVAALGIGGVVWASGASADVSGSERDRVAEAATEVVPGTVVDVDSSDDPGEAYEVEVRQDDGTEVDLTLDADLAVIGRDDDARDDDRRDDSRDDDRDDDRVLADGERGSAEQAALEAVGGGTVTGVEAGDDGDVAYEVDVRGADGQQWDVDLDAGFAVLSSTVGD